MISKLEYLVTAKKIFLHTNISQLQPCNSLSCVNGTVLLIHHIIPVAVGARNMLGTCPNASIFKPLAIH